MGKGIAIHTVIGGLLAYLGATFWMVGFAFFLKEYGEAKYRLPGSIWTKEKQIEMLKYSFKGWEQWVAPALAAYFISTM